MLEEGLAISSAWVHWPQGSKVNIPIHIWSNTDSSPRFHMLTGLCDCLHPSRWDISITLTRSLMALAATLQTQTTSSLLPVSVDVFNVGISCRWNQTVWGPSMTGFLCLTWLFQVYLHYSIDQDSIPLCLYILVLLYLPVNQLSICLCVHASVSTMVHI